MNNYKIRKLFLSILLKNLDQSLAWYSALAQQCSSAEELAVGEDQDLLGRLLVTGETNVCPALGSL